MAGAGKVKVAPVAASPAPANISRRLITVHFSNAHMTCQALPKTFDHASTSAAISIACARWAQFLVSLVGSKPEDAGGSSFLFRPPGHLHQPHVSFRRLRTTPRIGIHQRTLQSPH